MYNSGRTGSLSSGLALGKVCRTGILPVAALACCLLPACGPDPAGRPIRLTDLEHAPRLMLPAGQRVTVADPKVLYELCTPLGPRLGLLQVRSPADWARLVQAAPGLGPCPDLRAGTVVGLACWAGTTLDGRWPLRIDGVHLYRGAGLLEANFHGGTFLPDGTATLETAYVPGLAAILAADISGTTFCP
jgi:hypothetical protein